MEDFDDWKVKKINEASKLYSTLNIQPRTDYETFNLYNNFNEFYYVESDMGTENNLYWTRLSNTSNLTPTIG